MHSSRRTGVGSSSYSFSTFTMASSFGLESALATFDNCLLNFLLDLSVCLRLLNASERVLDRTSGVAVAVGGGVSAALLPATTATVEVEVDRGGADAQRC